MLKVALTGGLCCGKSTVAAELQRLGCPVLDADQIGHRFLLSGNPAHDEIVQYFGPAFLHESGAIDRRRLGERVFSNAEDRRRLNQILHPRIMAVIERELAELEQQGHPVGIVEAALLVEEGLYTRFDQLVVVTCKPEQKIQRFQARTGGSREEALARIRAQWPDDAKARLADFVIDNSGDRASLRLQVENLFSCLNASSASASQ